MLTYEKVIEDFKEYLEIDKNLEVIKLKHGYYLFIWDDVSKDYYYEGISINQLGELVYELVEEAEKVYKMSCEGKPISKISEEEKIRLGKFIKNIREKYSRYL